MKSNCIEPMSQWSDTFDQFVELCRGLMLLESHVNETDINWICVLFYKDRVRDHLGRHCCTTVERKSILYRHLSDGLMTEMHLSLWFTID